MYRLVTYTLMRETNGGLMNLERLLEELDATIFDGFISKKNAKLIQKYAERWLRKVTEILQ